MKIDGRRIEVSEPPYIIAEMSANHNGSIKRAYEIIEAAKMAGADAVKIQIYDPITLAEARGGTDYVLKNGPWAGRSLLSIYSEGVTPTAWVIKLLAFAEEVGITLFPSVFHVDDVYVLNAFGMPAFKVSSFDATNLPLIRQIALTGKPIIISTGMVRFDEVSGAFEAAQPRHPTMARSDCQESIDVKPGAVNFASCAVWSELALLHCVSDYPCPIEKANLGRIDSLRYLFQVPVGFSDHTIGNSAAIAAVARGACIIEKHLTLSRADGGLDSSFSSEPDEFRALVHGCRDAWLACQESEPDNAYKNLRVTA